MGKDWLPSWAGEIPTIDEKEITKTYDSDIVVVGLGNAGLLATLAAVREGASVNVLEAQPKKLFWMYGDPSIASLNSNWAKSKGLPHVDEMEFLAEYQQRTCNRSDPRLIKQFVERSGEMLDWLLSMIDPKSVEKAGVEHFPCSGDAYERGTSGLKTWQGTCLLWSWKKDDMWPVIDKLEGQGANIFWATKGYVLEKNSEGRVTGCIGQDEEGKYIRYNAKKGVILASGDYGNNHDMYVYYMDEIVKECEASKMDTSNLHTILGRDGSGHRMAVWAGGAVEPGPHALLWPTNGETAPTGDFERNQWGGGFLGTSFMRVNSKGKRYMDEGVGNCFGENLRTHRMGPGAYYSVFDSKWREYVNRQAYEHYLPDKGDEELLKKTEEALENLLSLGKEGEKGRKKFAYRWAANTIEELADYMGFEGEAKENFLEEVKRYNRMCYQKKDEDFGKDARLLMPIDKPPFYGTRSDLYCGDPGLVALNGVITDENQAVLDCEYNPIPGLYATGMTGGGKFFSHYMPIMSGMLVGSAMTFGMIVGEYVAKL